MARFHAAYGVAGRANAFSQILLRQVPAATCKRDRLPKAIGYTRKTAQYLTDYAKVMQIAGEVMAEYGMDQGRLNAAAGLDLKFMTAWYGSPHDHSGFDSSKIGTGEGAQAYGFGHYFASRKRVAGV